MKNWLGIHLESNQPDSATPVSWVLYGGERLLAHGCDALGEVRNAGGPDAEKAEVHVFVPGTAVMLTEVNIPSRDAAHLRKALPFMIEEQLAGDLRQEYVVQVQGVVQRRPEGLANPEMPTGEVEVQVQGLSLLNAARTPVFYVNEDDEVEEALRLRYVAATRAGAAIFITQRGKQNSYNPWCHFEPFLDEGCDLPDPGPRVPPATHRVPLAPQEAEEAQAQVRLRLDRVRRPGYDARPLKEYALSPGGDALWGGVTAGEEGVAEAAPHALPASPPPAGEHGVEWGEVMHLLLRAAMVEPGADLERLAAAALAEVGLQPSLAPQAAALARSVSASDIWGRAIGSDMRLVEVPLQALWNEGVPVPTILRGVIDLIFREDGGWVLVDYKTDRLDEGGAGEAARGYAPQVRLYAEAWEKCTGEAVKEAFLYFTATATLVRAGAW